MAHTTSLRPSYMWRSLLIAAVCIVLGLWGVYDYFVAIPHHQQKYEQFRVLEASRNALEANSRSDDYQQRHDEALEIVAGQIDPIVAEVADRIGIPARSARKAEDAGIFQLLFVLAVPNSKVPDALRSNPVYTEAEQIATAMQGRSDAGWLAELLVLNQALRETKLRAPRAPGESHLGTAAIAWERTQNRLNELGSIKPPSKFDHMMQWAFILCLPFGPYYLWRFVQARGRVYTLDDDGGLKVPEGSWTRDQIAGIDMKRWMAKSIATIKTTDNKEVRLDDYVYRDMHLIVGAIAHRFEPEKWNEDATVVKDDEAVTPSDGLPEEEVVEAAATDDPAVNERGEPV